MGYETRTDERLVAEAARWCARLAADDCTDFERAQFQRWRASSRRHADAFDSTTAFSRKFAARADRDVGLQAVANDAFAVWAGDGRHQAARVGHADPRSPRSRRWMVPATL